MTTVFDAPTLALLEEHVRHLLQAMGFAEATVHCRHIPGQGEAAAPEVMDDWLGNKALEPGGPRRPGSGASPWRESIEVMVEAGEAGKMLIGAHGVHLLALEHIVRCVLRQQLPERVGVTLDVNGYRARRERNLAQLALAVADQAKASGRTVTLKPMGAADRRAIHTALSARRDVWTESTGEEPHRRVVVRPVF